MATSPQPSQHPAPNLAKRCCISTTVLTCQVHTCMVECAEQCTLEFAHHFDGLQHCLLAWVHGWPARMASLLLNSSSICWPAHTTRVLDHMRACDHHNFGQTLARASLHATSLPQDTCWHDYPNTWLQQKLRTWWRRQRILRKPLTSIWISWPESTNRCVGHTLNLTNAALTTQAPATCKTLAQADVSCSECKVACFELDDPAPVSAYNKAFTINAFWSLWHIYWTSKENIDRSQTCPWHKIGKEREREPIFQLFVWMHVTRFCKTRNIAIKVWTNKIPQVST